MAEQDRALEVLRSYTGTAAEQPAENHYLAVANVAVGVSAAQEAVLLGVLESLSGRRVQLGAIALSAAYMG